MDYENKSERELIDLAQEGDKIASNILAKNYTPLVHKIAKPYFMKGYDRQDNDLVQEGFIGLTKAIQDYDHDSPIKFSTFAGNLIKNMIINAITKANRQKHKIINQAMSLDEKYYKNNPRDEGQRTLMDLLANDDDIEEQFVTKELLSYLVQKMKNECSELEFKSFFLFHQGYSYDEIAQRQNRHSKSIDNALYRARKRAEKIVS